MCLQLELQKFIYNHPNSYKELLSDSPYCLSIKEMDNRIMFTYKQGRSDFSYPLVREARGIILDSKTLKVICMGFSKFFVHNSIFADSVDWNNLSIEEKYDGTLITLYFYQGKWIPATTGTIDAHNTPNIHPSIGNFADLFDIAAENSGLDYTKLNPNYCHMFELISPYNKLIVDYQNTEIIHIGTRDLTTLKELDTFIGVHKPERYNIKNIDDALRYVNSDTYKGEGFVAVDKDYNRIKIKSEDWFIQHYKFCNSPLTIATALEYIISDDADEYMSNYPLNKDFVIDIQTAYKNVIKTAQQISTLSDICIQRGLDKKQSAFVWNKFLHTYFNDDYRTVLHSYSDVFFGTFNDITYQLSDFMNNLFPKHLLCLTTYEYNKLKEENK